MQEAPGIGAVERLLPQPLCRRAADLPGMHELSIALSLVDAASEAVAKLGRVQVVAVRLRLGPLSGVFKEALRFSFEAAAAGTPIEGATLDVEDVPASVWCETCRAERELQSLAKRRCAICLSPAPRIVRGDELELVGVEVRSA